MDIFKEAEKIIDWYIKNSNREQSINIILTARDRLAGYSYYIAQQVAETKTEYNLAYYIRKIQVNKSTQGFINNKIAISKAKIDAELENEALIKTEIELEAQTYRADLLLKQINKILDAISQRIAYLKVENSLTKIT